MHRPYLYYIHKYPEYRIIFTSDCLVCDKLLNIPTAPLF